MTIELAQSRPMFNRILATECDPSLGSTTFSPVALRVYYTPFYVRTPFIIDQFSVFNGAAPSGNVDIGIYDMAAVKLVSTGSTARAGASVLQDIGVTDYYISPGRYWVAFVSSSTTQLAGPQVSNIGIHRAFGWRSEDIGGLPLPTTPVFTDAPTTAAWPLVGIITRSV